MNTFSKSQSWGGRPRSNRWVIFSVIVVIGTAAVYGIRSNSDSEVGARFEAHEFAVFRSTYETLKFQNIETRREHFRTLVEAAESATLTQAMAENLAEFCNKVVASTEEVPEVKEEAAAALLGLNAKIAAKTQHSSGADRKPASDGP